MDNNSEYRYNDRDGLDDENPSGKKRRRKKFTIGKFFKSIGILLIIAVYVLIFGRMFLARNTGIMNRFVWTENSVDYFNKNGEFDIYTETLEESINDDGYYYISNLSYVKEFGEIQLTLRYNNSTLDVLDSYYNDRTGEGEPFVFTLTDNNGNVYDTYLYAESSNIIYNFRRIVFDDIDFSNTQKLYLNVYYAGDVSSSSPMYVSFKIYDAEKDERKSDIKVKMKDPTSDALKQSPTFMIFD